MRDQVLVSLVQTCLGLSEKNKVRVQVNWLLFITSQQFPIDFQGKWGWPQEGTTECELFSWWQAPHLAIDIHELIFSPLRHPKGAGFYYSIFSEE